MLESVKRLLEFVGDMNENEVNAHIKVDCGDDGVISFYVDNEWLDGWNRAVLATLRKVEQEVSERYMELPVDADGVPIRVGDVMETDIGIREVDALQKSSRKWSVGLVPVGGGAFSWHDAETLRHYHKPTIEDVLFEILEKAAPRGFEDGSYVFGLSDDEFAKYADKLREVMAGE